MADDDRGGSQYPVAVVHAALAGRLRLVLLGLLGAAALLAAATLVANWRQAAARQPGTDVRWTAPRWLTTLLAFLGLANALLAYLVPEAIVIVHPVETQGTIPSSPADPRLHTVDLGAAFALVALGAAALAADATFTWFCLVENWRLRGGPQAGQRWRHIFAHAYIWGLYIVPYLAHQVPMQITLRDRAFEGFFLDPNTQGVSFAVSVAMTLLSLVVNTLVRLGIISYFASRWCFYQPEELVADGPARDCSDGRLRRWRTHCARSATYASCSLGLYVGFWFALVLYPYAYCITLTTTPFHMAMLLVAQLCFQARIPLARHDDGASQQPEEQPRRAASATAAAAPAPSANAAEALPPSRENHRDDDNDDGDNDDHGADGHGDGIRRRNL